LSDDTILQVASLIMNGIQVMFLAYLAARFRPPMPPPEQ
jgi:hypothetical protein